MRKTRNLLIVCSVLLSLTCSGYQVYASPDSHQVAPQQEKQGAIKITGTVTDTNGEPIIGATVKFKDQNIGTVTDIDGKYSITTPSRPSSIQVSFIGYIGRHVVYTGQSVIDVKLEEDSKLLDEVVVTGYQTISKDRATGSFGILNNKEMDKKISLNATSALEGQMAGVVVQNDKIVIRGRSTLSDNVGTDPLLVIDGMPTERSINDLNMNDVENFTVLKDAAASSIYGVRAANGVIVVTTKKGQIGKTNVSISADWQWKENPSLSDYRLASTSETIDYEMAYWDREMKYTSYQSELDYFNSTIRGIGNEPDRAYDTPIANLRWRRAKGEVTPDEFTQQLNQWRQNDYVKEYMDQLWRTPLQQNYNIAISTATERQNTYVSLKYIQDNYQNVEESAQRFKAYIKSNQKITNWLNLEFGVDAQLSKSNTVASGSRSYNASAIDNGFPVERYRRILDEHGNREQLPWSRIIDKEITSVFAEETKALDPSFFSNYNYNVLDDITKSQATTKGLGIRSWLGLNFKLYKGLTFATSFSYETNKLEKEEYYEADSYYLRYHRNRVVSQSGNTYTKNLKDGGLLKKMETPSSNYVFRNQLEYKEEIAQNHSVNAVAGIELRETQTNMHGGWNTYTGYDPQTLSYYTTPNLETYLTNGYLSYLFGDSQKLSSIYSPATLRDVMHRYVGMYGTAGYSYKNLYNASASFRIDQADLFGTDPKYRYRPLWSVGAGWNLSNEEFMKDITWLDHLSVKGSYGITGNVDQTSTPYIVATGRTITNFLNNSVHGTTLDATAPNPNLRWEKTTSYSGEIDFSIFKRLLNGKIEAYYKYSDDLLARKDMETYAFGYTTAVVNNGAMSNRGIEFTLNSPWFSTKDWQLSSTFIYSYNKNKVEKVNFNPQIAEDLTGLNYYLEGNPRYSLYAYTFGGLTSGGTDEQNGAPIIIRADGQPTYVFNEDGTLSFPDLTMRPEDVKYMGSLDPTWTGSFTQNIAYKNFELSVMFTYSGGNVMRKPTYNWYSPTTYCVDALILDAWSPTNIRSSIPKSILNYSGRMNTQTAQAMTSYWQYSDANVVSGDYVKLRNISLTYRMPQRLAKKIGLNSLKATGQINNLCFWSAAGDGIDPEARSMNSLYWTPSTPRSYLFRIEASF